MERKCEGCEFFLETDSTEDESLKVGQCRIGPPHYVVLPDNKCQWSFPQVRGEHWCGAFNEKTPRVES